MSREVTKQHQTFEQIKQVNEHGSEYWMARKLTKVLGYSEFRNFLPVIEKAKTAYRKSGQPISDHFVEMHEMVDIGSGARREMDSLALSRYACYLIVQNCNSSNPGNTMPEELPTPEQRIKQIERKQKKLGKGK